MTKIALSLFFGGLSLFGFSQQNTVSSGGEASGTGGTVSYSIGQIDYSNNQGATGSVNQGVQQPYEFYLLGIGSELTIDVSLFPNPTNEFIILQLENFENDMMYVLSDMNGKIVARDHIKASETHIDMRTLATGQYNLQVASNTTNQTVKIIKH